MTKDWASVREEACYYYFEKGESLTKISERLRERGFEAGERTFRLKLKQWGAKRPRTVKGAIPDEQASSINHSPQQSLIGQSCSVAETVQVSQLDAHGRPNISHACQCRAQELDPLVRQLYDFAANEKSAAPAAASLHFAEGDNVIHFLARDSRWAKLKTFNEIMDYSLSKAEDSGLSIDAKDCDGMTALEISIRTDNLSAVKILMDHGASLELTNIAGDSVLAVGIRCSSNVPLIAELLRRIEGASVPYDSVLDRAYPNKEALANIDSIVRSSDHHDELEDAYRVIRHISLHVRPRPNLYPHRVIKLALRIVLENWLERGLAGTQWAPDCVRRLLQSGIGIFDWDPFWRRRGDQCSCWDPISFAIFHVVNEDIINATLDMCKSRLHTLVMSILDVCRDRSARCDKAYLTRLLKCAMETWDDNEYESTDVIDCLSMMMAGSLQEMRSAFWKAMVGLRSVNIHELGVDCTTLATTLADTDDSSRWELAELVLTHDPGFPTSARTFENKKEIALFFPVAQTDFSHYASKPYLDHLCHWSSKECRENGIEYPDGLSISESCGCHKLIDQDGDGDLWWQRRAQRAVRMQECVVHVVTKDLCNRESLFVPDQPLGQRIRSALRLREQFSELSTLVIEPALLLKALSDPTDEKNDAASECSLKGSQGSHTTEGLKSHHRSASLGSDDEGMEIDRPMVGNLRM